MPFDSNALTSDHLATLAKTVRNIAPMPDEQRALLRQMGRVETMPKGACLLQAGQKASTVGVMLEGGLREYDFLPNGSERTKGFSLPGWFAGSLSDLISQKPSKVWVVAEVPSLVLTIPWAD